MQLSLNELFIEYSAGTMNRAELEGLIYNFLVYNQDKTCISHWKTDDYEDFISWFYPRLQMAIESYNDIGSSFEAFMRKYFLISAKEYQVRTVTNYVTEHSTWSARIPDMYVYEEPPVYNVHKETKDAINKLIIDKKGRKNTRRILALILKCYYYISDDFAEKIAPIIGVEKNELIQMLNKMRKTRQDKDDQIYHFKERIYCQFYRCFVYEKRLTIVKENTNSYNNLKAKLERARQRLEKMRRRLTRIRIDATNRQVADIIGTTKGTVDASLSRLKTKWNKMSKKANLN